MLKRFSGFIAIIMLAVSTFAQDNFISQRPYGQHTVAFSATPVFDASLTNSFKITLTGNVTSSTLVGAEPGLWIYFEICQDATGGRTFVWPTQMVNAPPIYLSAGTCSIVVFFYDGTNANGQNAFLEGVPVNTQTGTSYTIATTDRLTLVTMNNASAVAVTLPQAGSTGFGSNFTFVIKNLGAGTVTVTPTTSTINGASSISLANTQWALIYSDNLNYFALLSGTGSGTVTVTGSPVSPNLTCFSSGTAITNCATVSAHQFYGNNTGSSGLPVPVLIGTSDVSPNQYVAGGGTAQAQTATLTPAATALTTGLEVHWLPIAANTGAAPTLNVNGLGAKNITKLGTAALVANDLTTTAIAIAIYDGTEFQLINAQTGGGGSGSVTSVDGSGSNGVQTVQGGAIAAITGVGSVQGSQVVNAQSGTTYTIVTGDRGKVIVQTNSSTIADTLPQATTGTASAFGPGWYTDIYNSGATSVTVTPTTSTINANSSLQINGGQWAHIVSDGTNYDAWTTDGAPSQVNVTAVTATANVTTDQTLQEISLPAGYLNTLKQPYWFHGSGIYTIPIAQTPTITLKIKLCTATGQGGTCVTIANITSGNTTTLSTNNWNLNVLAVPNATGASGTLLVHGNPGLTLDLTGTTSGADTVYGDTNTGASGAINLTAALFVDFTVAFSTGSASNAMTQQLAAVMPQSNPASAGSGGGGSGTVTSVSAPPPMFTVTNPTTTPAITWSNPNTAQNIDVFAPFSGWPNARVTRKVVALAIGSFGGDGEALAEVGTGGNIILVTATAPVMVGETTGTTINTPAGVSPGSGGSAQLHRTGRTHGIMEQMAGSMTPITTMRMFRGLTDQTLPLQVAPGGGAGSDVAAGNYVGFMFSTTGTYTGLTDTTHFVCVTKDNTTQNAVASSITADTAFHYFALWEDVSNSKWHFYIDNAEVCGTGISTNIPPAGTNLRYVDAILNLAASSNAINTAWVVTQDDK
jgi:hypothetical protein